MSDPLAMTFGVLTASDSPHVFDVLVAGLQSDRAPIQRQAAFALVNRSNSTGVIEVVRHLYELAPSVRSALVDRRSSLSAGLRQCLLHGDRALQRNALELILECEDFDQVPALLSMLSNPDGALHVEAGHALGELIDRLHAHCHQPRDAAPPRFALRHAPQVRAKTIAALEEACVTFARLVNPEPVVQGILVLGDPDHAAVRKVLIHPVPDCREVAVRILRTSAHFGVMQFLIETLSRNYPHPRVMEAIAARTDPEFVQHLLRWFPERLSANQQRNFKELKSIAWLDEGLSALETLPESLQPGLVRFVTSTGISGDIKLAVQEWVVRHGSLEGRAAAAGVLESLDETAVQGIINEGLASKEESVQAWATSQLRSHGVPQAITMLLERLDSPLPAVKQAAQEELGSFDLYRVLDLCDHLSPAVALEAGRLVRKTDVHCLERLEAELTHSVRRRRIHAARGARALGMHGEIVPALLAMLEDEDPLVRRTAIEVLAEVPSGEAIKALADHLNDPSPRVRDAAARGMAGLRDALASRATPE